MQLKAVEVLDYIVSLLIFYIVTFSITFFQVSYVGLFLYLVWKEEKQSTHNCFGFFFWKKMISSCYFLEGSKQVIIFEQGKHTNTHKCELKKELHPHTAPDQDLPTRISQVTFKTCNTDSNSILCFLNFPCIQSNAYSSCLLGEYCISRTQLGVFHPGLNNFFNEQLCLM